jgi:thiamine biosynthesis lipoprotein
MLPSNSRRDFLHPKTLGKLAATLSGGEWGGEAEAEAASGWLCRARREAMATRFEVLLEALDMDRLPVAEAALDLVSELEDQLTIYQETSELAAINRLAFNQAVPVEERLFGLLQVAKRIWEETEGCLDIAVHSLLVEWGLFRGPRKKLSPEEVNGALARSGMSAVHLDLETKSIRMEREGVGLNLGAIGKGYALDRVAEVLENGGLGHFMVHGGHSSVLARGSSTWENGWLVGLADPAERSRPIAQIRLENQSISTSALELETILLGETPHILDPRTGFPVQTDLLSATVRASSAAHAEGLSTAFLVMGLDKTLEYCGKYPEIGVVALRRPSGSDDLDLIHTGIPRRALEVLL